MALFISLVIYLFISLVLSYLYTNVFDKRLSGKFLISFIVSLVGCAIGSFIFDQILCYLMDLIDYLFIAIRWLMGDSAHNTNVPINILATLLGGILFITIFSKISPK